MDTPALPPLWLSLSISLSLSPSPSLSLSLSLSLSPLFPLTQLRALRRAFLPQQDGALGPLFRAGGMIRNVYTHTHTHTHTHIYILNVRYNIMLHCFRCIPHGPRAGPARLVPEAGRRSESTRARVGTDVGTIRVGTDPSRHGSESARIRVSANRVGADPSRCGSESARIRVGADVGADPSGRGSEWTRIRVGTDPGRHGSGSARIRVGADPSRHSIIRSCESKQHPPSSGNSPRSCADRRRAPQRPSPGPFIDTKSTCHGSPGFIPPPPPSRVMSARSESARIRVGTDPSRRGFAWACRKEQERKGTGARN